MHSFRSTGHLRLIRVVGFLVLPLAIALAGCGSKGAKVTGTVTYDGKAVTGGTLVFSPAVGGSVPASVPVKSDGTFESTAVPVGKCRLIYNSPGDQFPEGYTPKPSEPAPRSPFNGLVPKEQEVEVKGGASKLDVVLVKPGK